MGEILTKKIFPRKVNLIQLIYAFLLFWSILGEIHRELLFLCKKELSLKGALNYTESLFFLTSFKRGKYWVNLICLNNCIISNQLNWGKYLQKLDFLLKVSHIQLNYAFLLFLSIFVEIHRELLVLVIKWLSQKGIQNAQKSVFLNMFEKGQILR